MSLINQMLLDLERRRASAAERGQLPDHVRALPDLGHGARTAWIVAIGGAIVLAAAAVWIALSGFGFPGAGRMPGLAAPRATARPDHAVVASRPDAAAPARSTTITSPAARMSFELSNVPAPLPGAGDDTRPPPPIPTSEVVAESRSTLPREPSSAATREAPTVPATNASGAERPPSRPKAASPATAQPAAGVPQEARPEIDKKVRQPTPHELAESEYARATTLLNQGKLTEARASLEAALRHNPAHHRARQALLGVLIETKKNAEAEQLLQEGLQIAPAQIGFAMALARLQVDGGNTPAAIDTLQKSASYAQSSGEYLAFLAALLQREQRHDEAIEQFRAALRLKPDSGVWLLGLGMSLQAANRGAEARDAFRRAKASGNLNPSLQAFADQRLQQLQ